MKHGHALAIGTLALALAACGGGSHHGSSTTTTTTTTTTTPGATTEYRIEAIINPVTVSAGPGSGGTVNPDPGYRFQDLQNIELRDNITFQLVSYSGSGTSLVRNVAPVSGDPTAIDTVTFTTSDARLLSGALTPTDGTFVASSNAVGPYTISANFGGANYTASYTINPRQIRLHGAVVVDSGSKDGNGNPIYRGIYNAQIDFYEARSTQSGRQIVRASVHTAEDGTFRASVPLPVSGDVRFAVRPPVGYATTFAFQGGSYTPESSPTDAEVLSDFPSLASTLTPSGAYQSGDFYLVQGTGISTSASDAGPTFNFLTQDDFNRDSGNLILLTTDSSATTSLTKSAKKR